MSNMLFDGKRGSSYKYLSDFENVWEAIRKLFSGAFLEPCQTSMMEFCVKTILTVNYLTILTIKQFTIFAKVFLKIDAWQGLNPF